MNTKIEHPETGRSDAPAQPTETRQCLPKWAAVVNDSLVLLPQHATARLIKEEAGESADLTLVRDLGSPNDIPLNDESQINLAEGNVFYTLPHCEAKPASGCAAPPKLAFVINDRAEQTLNPHQTGRALRELFGFAPAVRLFRDYESPNDTAIGLDDVVEFPAGPVFYTRRAEIGLTIIVNKQTFGEADGVKERMTGREIASLVSPQPDKTEVIKPDVFCQPQARKKVKRILRESLALGSHLAYQKAAEQAEPVEPNQIAIEHLEEENPFRLPGFKSPMERHTLIYDSFDESLESFYFWLLDELTADGWDVSKLADTFLATPGSGLFAELTRRESRAQQEAAKLLREAHALVRDILRTASFLKEENEFTERNREGQIPSQIERGLLRSKIESLKLYARWLGPYLKQSRQLEQNAKGTASLVNLFNSAVAEVTLLAQREYPVNEDVDRGDLPRFILQARRRELFSVLILEFKFRAAPEQTAGREYGYRGRFELTLTSYALNADELAVLRRELDRDNLDTTLRALGGDSSKAIAELVKQVEALVAGPAKEKRPEPNDPNPFTSLFAFKKMFGNENKKIEASSKTIELVPGDSEIERVVRSQVILEARRRCLQFYNRCKSALQMPAMDN